MKRAVKVNKKQSNSSTSAASTLKLNKTKSLRISKNNKNDSDLKIENNINELVLIKSNNEPP